MNLLRPGSALLFLAVALLFPLRAPAVEREAAEEEEAKVVREKPKPEIGYSTVSGLRQETGGKAFFFLNNDAPWPQKMTVPEPPPKPAVQTQRPPKIVAAAAPEAAADTKARATEQKPEKSQKAAAGKEAKKQTAAKKRATALPDIEQLLADVRRSAAPRGSVEDMPRTHAVEGTPSEPPAAPERRPEPSRRVTEVEGVVDIDALARDLEDFQKNREGGVSGGAAKEPAKTPEVKAEETAPPSQTPWWEICAAVTVCAAAAAGMILVIRRRRKMIRPQTAIDAETRAYFKKLYTEHRRKAAATATPPPPMQPEPASVSVAAPPPEPEPEELPAAEEQNVFLLPPELAEGAYKEVVLLAGMGDSPATIAQKLNLGEGEVRLVLDLARLSRQKATA